MPSKTYYKVVQVFPDKEKACGVGIYSYGASEICISNSPLPDDIVEYRIGEWVKPKIKKSKLFVFGTLAHAELFKNSYSGARGTCFEIFECEVQKPRKITKISVCPSRDWDFWANYGHQLIDSAVRTSILPSLCLDNLH